MITIQSFTFNPFQENTYLLYDESGTCFIIDPGCYTKEEKKNLSGYIEEQDLTPVRLINTHCHLDHVFGNRYIADKYDLKPELHRLELPVLHSVPQVAHVYGIPNVDISPEPEYFLEEGDEIFLGDSALEVLFVPGHAPGHIALVCKKQKFVIAGDVLFYGSIGRTDLPGGDHQTLISSIKEKLFGQLSDDFKVYCGHGPETTIGFERQHNPFLR